jgi:hypothetical protein
VFGVHEGLSCDYHDAFVACPAGIWRQESLKLFRGIGADDGKPPIGQLEDVRTGAVVEAAPLTRTRPKSPLGLTETIAMVKRHEPTAY